MIISKFMIMEKVITDLLNAKYAARDMKDTNLLQDILSKCTQKIKDLNVNMMDANKVFRYLVSVKGTILNTKLKNLFNANFVLARNIFSKIKMH